FVFFFSSRRRHTRSKRDWSSDVCSSDLDLLHLKLILLTDNFVLKKLFWHSGNLFRMTKYWLYLLHANDKWTGQNLQRHKGFETCLLIALLNSIVHGSYLDTHQHEYIGIDVDSK